MKKSFVLYIDNYEPIKLLTLVQKGQLLDYMFMYNLGIEIEIDDPVLKMAFSFFEQTFIRDNKKWNDTAERNRKNGSKGGRPIKNDSNELNDNPENPEEPSGLFDNPENPLEPKKAVSVSVSVSGIVSAIGKEKDLLSDSTESDHGGKGDYPEPFLKFWKAYPKKEGIAAAFKAYQKIKAPRPTLNIIIDSIETHSKTEKWKNKQYIPLPATFLNQRRWEDEFTQEDFNGTKPATGYRDNETTPFYHKAEAPAGYK